MDLTGMATAPVELLDPTAERVLQERPLSAGVTTPGRVALLDISKPRGGVFLDALEELLVHRGWTVERAAKPTFARTAPADLRRELAERVDGVVEALAD